MAFLSECCGFSSVAQRDKKRFGNLKRMESETETSLSSQSSGISEFSDDDVSLMELGSGNYGYASFFCFQLNLLFFFFCPFNGYF